MSTVYFTKYWGHGKEWDGQWLFILAPKSEFGNLPWLWEDAKYDGKEKCTISYLPSVALLSSLKQICTREPSFKVGGNEHRHEEIEC